MTRINLFGISFLFFLFSIKGKGQDLLMENSIFFQKKWTADSLFNIRKYEQAEKYYKIAYKHTKYITFHQSTDKNLALLYFKNNQLKRGERRVFQLLESGYIVKNWSEVLPDTSLLGKQKWERLKSINESNKSKAIGNNKELIQTLQSLRTQDQKFRKTEYLDSLKSIYPEETANKIYSNIIIRIDSINTHALKDIIALHGWPSIKQVGYEGIGICWLIVQHADNDIAFQKEALKYIEEAVLKGEGSLVNFAYLTDRVLVNSGEKQLFATQFGDPIVDKQGTVIELAFKPIKDENKVDFLRNAFGLPPANEYKKYCFERWYGKKK